MFAACEAAEKSKKRDQVVQTAQEQQDGEHTQDYRERKQACYLLSGRFGTVIAEFP